MIRQKPSRLRADGRRSRPRLETLEPRSMLSVTAATTGGEAAVSAEKLAGKARPLLQVELGQRFNLDPGQSGVTDHKMVVVRGQTDPGMMVGMDVNHDGRFDRFARANRQGRFLMLARVHDGAGQMMFGFVHRRDMGMVPLTVVGLGSPSSRSFNGSPTPGGQPFTRIIPNPLSARPGLPPRPDARAISASMAEDPNHPAYSSTIELGMVFFGQFVDHDVNLNTIEGNGPTPNPAQPINTRTPALDLDTVYGKGPKAQPEFYTSDGLFFKLGTNGQDLLRNGQGVAIIGDPRNDDNGAIAQIHLAFQKFHNMLMTRALHGLDPNSLSQSQKDALFGYVHDQVIGYYQGIVTNELGRALTGKPIPTNEPPLANIPLEFDAAGFRIGHSLVPNTIIVDHNGTRMSPTDPALRSPNVTVPYDLLFGPHAQPAAALDAKISNAMRTLLIPLSPSDPSQGDLIGGNQPNIGQGQIIDGVMHLDLGETNILRGREVGIPSGEEYLAFLQGRRYNPRTDGNTDLFEYVLDEAAPLGHLGKVGTDIIDRALGGTIAADPYRFDNPAVFSRLQIAIFRHATMEGLLHAIGAPDF